MVPSDKLPLNDLSVLDLSTGMAPALGLKLLVAAGAKVTRLEPPGGDPFYRRYPAYRYWQGGKSILRAADQDVVRLAREVDLVVLGGEDDPGLTWSWDATVLQRQNPKLTVLEFREPVLAAADRAFPAVDLLAQAASGLCCEHFSDRPIAHAIPFASYGAALSGIIGALGSLYAQRRGAPARHIRTSLLQGALFWQSSFWFDLDGAPATSHPTAPKDTRQLLFRCKDGGFLQITLGLPGSGARLDEVLGLDAGTDAADRGMPSGLGDPRNFYGDATRYAPYFAQWDSRALLEVLHRANIIAEVVAAPGDSWSDPQVLANKIFARSSDGVEHVGDPIEFAGRQVPPSPRAGRVADGLDGSVAPLSGVRVLDFGTFVAGPYSSVPLVDLGAEVTKVEPPSGDPMRPLVRHYSPYNRGKRSIVVDAKKEAGRLLLKKLCAQSDIVIHNYRPGVPARLGIDFASLRTANPSVVVLQYSAYGEHGPKSALPGFDMIFQASAGLDSRSGTDLEPICQRFPAVDLVCAALGTVGVLAALVGRAGTDVRTNLVNGSHFLMSDLVRRPDGSFDGMTRSGADLVGEHPAEALYQVADGWIAVAARDEEMAQRLVDAAAPDLPTTPLSRWGQTHRDVLERKFRAMNRSEALELLSASDVWAAPCVDDGWKALKADPVLRSGGAVVEGAAGRFGVARQVGQLFTVVGADAVDGERGRIDPPGGHSRAILDEIGLSETEIGELLDTGVVIAVGESTS